MIPENSFRNSVFEYVRKKYGDTPEYMWQKTPDAAVLRHNDNRKWYAIVMVVSRRILKLDEDGLTDILNVKCNPLLIGSLQQEEGFLPAYHMNKSHWITVLLDGTVDVKRIFALVDLSYRMTEIKGRGEKK